MADRKLTEGELSTSSSETNSPTTTAHNEKELDILPDDLRKELSLSRRQSRKSEILESEEEIHHVISSPIDLDRVRSNQSWRRTIHHSKRYPDGIAFDNKEDEEAARDVLDPENPDDIEEVVPDEYLVDWDGPDDPANPRNWKLWYKVFGLVTVAVQTLVVIYTSTAYVAASPGMAVEFGITSDIAIVSGVTTYLFGLALGPLFLAPLSEMFGRRPVYLISYSIFVILTLPVCLAKNFATIVAVRFFAGLAGSSTIGNAGGTIADMFAPQYRASAYAVFAVAPMNGPSFGPIIGGFVFQYLGWRWVNWVTMIWAGVMLFISLFLTETYAPAILRKKSAKARKETGDPKWCSPYDHAAGTFSHILRTNLIRAITMLFTEPICIFWSLYVSVVYSILYMSFVAYPIIFTQERGFSPSETGLSYLGILVGTFCAIASDPFIRWVYNKHPKDPITGKTAPEALVWSCCVGAFLIPIGIIWFAWTGEPKFGYHYTVPIASGIPFGMGNTLIFIHGSNYLLNSYGIYAASAMAGNTVTRSMLGGIMPLFTAKMYTTLSPPWAGTLCAGLAALLIPIPICFYKWGSRFRARSPMLLALEVGRQE